MNYLLDTDTCIYWLKGRQPVRDKLLAVGWDEVCICVITAAELYYGAYNSNRVSENLSNAEDFIQNLSVLSLTDHALRKYGELKAELRRIGQTIAEFDLLIASVALAENYTLVTNNTRHYERINGLKLENWTLL
ncbi:type II toxin-antitoxin system VapC family toxin [Nostoc sp. ChiSLP03a]|uniref:type II toxin-antitoxin system VapC family toxin n=1 Tax=Nostoc sp. ChiSLP03a TaxID=3075380 RepID=UPI002AD4A4D2|nr:type II toxin-antitoxin system VapC family toxin [Nostoc sp. ChiSLP03a]MDZ8215946.1 type II toxin-antitoxin system VapC family toxin [Nostoc sp. ChiSLP03a]